MTDERPLPTAPPAAAGSDAARLAAEPPTVCLNCGAALPGQFCPDCGQRAQPLRTPLHRFLGQMITEFFGIDGRVWRTLGALLFKPGKLTAEFVAGRRRRYLSPLRVYISATLLFFLLLAILDPVGRVREEIMSGAGAEADSLVVVAEHLDVIERRIAEEPARVARAQREADSLQTELDRLLQATIPGGAAVSSVDSDSAQSFVAAQVPDSTYEEVFKGLLDDVESAAEDLGNARTRAQRRTAQWGLEAAILRTLPPDSTVRLGDIHAARAQVYPENNAEFNLPDWMIRSESVRRLRSARTDTDAADAFTTFIRDSVAKVPTVLFFVLPVFALLLKLLYIRRGWFYSEHLIFGLHTHAYAFAVFTLVTAIAVFAGQAGWSTSETADTYSSNPGWLSLLLVLTIPIYFVVAQKRVYGQGWLKTVLKSVALGSAYFFVLVGGLVVTFLLAAAAG